MNSMLQTCRPLCNDVSPPRRWLRGSRAFSLVEVTLALGLVTFVLVAVIGTMPVALSSGHQSLDQNRSSAIADSLFASFRGQSFNNVCYLDRQFDANGQNPTPSAGLNLNLMKTAVSTTPPAPSTDPTKVQAPQVFYASFLEANATSSGDEFGTQRKLTFTAANVNASTGVATPSGPLNGAGYLVALYFNNQPEGMAVLPSAAAPDGETTAASTTPAQANQIEMVISPVSQPATKYHFVSTIANRL